MQFSQICRLLLVRLSDCLLERFQRSGEQRDIDLTIALHRLMLDSESHHIESPYRWILMDNLAHSRYKRYEKWEDIADLERVIGLWREAVSLCPRDDRSRYRLLDTLASSLSLRNGRCGTIDDLDEIIDLLRDALSLIPNDHQHRSGILDRLGSALHTCFRQSGREGVLDECIVTYRDAVALRKEGHPDRSISLHNLANALRSRFERSGNSEDLDESIQLNRSALVLHPEGHPNRSSSLNSLANTLQIRFEQCGGVEDLDEAIKLYRDALVHRTDGHPERSASLSGLANALWSRFEQSGRPRDLDESIELNRDALALRPEGHPDRSSSFSNLANCLQIRFEQRGNAGDLDEAIQLNRDALALRGQGHPDRSASLSNLANTLHTRFDQSGNLDDLKESMQLHLAALALRPVGHPERCLSLNNLGSNLLEHFKQEGKIEVLTVSIQSFRNALSLLPENHPRRCGMLCNLGCALHARFKRGGHVDDLNESIRLYRDALALRPEGHPDRPSSLNNLAVVLMDHADLNKNVASLDEAVAHLRECLSFLPDGHLDRSSRLSNIANALYTRFETVGHTGDYEESIHFLKQAADYKFSSSLVRLDIACRWTVLARRHDHYTTIDAYRTAIALLDHALTVRPTLSKRHDLLRSNEQYQTLAVNAASYAIEKADLSAAVEFLEQGRALLWSQMRGFRTPLDQLAKAMPPLAERFRTVSRKLEALMTSSESRTMGPTGGGVALPGLQNRSPVDAMPERVRRLSEEQETLTDEIRQVPGFEDFLRAASFSELRKASSEGPVIMVNHSQHRCDAIIIPSRPDAPCVCVPLDEDWFQDSLNLCNEFLDTRYRRRVQSSEYDGILRRVMRVLWDRVVSKVVRKLEELEILKGSRIWWCPTRFLTLLPFHAAGPYESSGGSKYLLDDYISSYTPTLKSLLAARASRGGVRTEIEKLLFVGDTSLPSAKKERDEIRKRRRIRKSLLDEKASRDAVLSAIRKAEWVHFTCHGSLDMVKPFESAFSLPGGKLTLLDITKANIPNAEFAFLSACHTAEQAPSFAQDEALHLAAAMQFCGFRSVVGTMWQLLDRDGPLLAGAVYTHLMSATEDEQPRFKGAAAAVREAALYLRSQKDWTDDGRAADIATERWVNLVHIGA